MTRAGRWQKHVPSVHNACAQRCGKRGAALAIPLIVQDSQKAKRPHQLTVGPLRVDKPIYDTCIGACNRVEKRS